MPAGAAAPPEPLDKRRYVREVFSEIAPRYDFLNHLLSLNIDRSWRRRVVERLGWERTPAGVFLDACAGTMDLSAALATRPGFQGHVVASDFALPMLRLGRAKTRGGVVTGTVADTLDLPFADGTFDGAMVAFGVRNLSSLEAGLSELLRVLRPEARLVILDFTIPPSAPMRAAYLFYFRRVLPLVGRIVSGHPTAYRYLPDSVGGFPPPGSLVSLLAHAGFRDPGYVLLTGGIAAVHWGLR